MIWCEQRIDNAKSCLCRANSPVLCCAVCLLAVLRSDQQYGCNLHGGENMGTERGQINEEKTKRRVHNMYYYTWYYRVTAGCSKESTAQHDTAPQRRARHGTAPHVGSTELPTDPRSHVTAWASG